MVILEIPWLACHNPEIDWRTGEVKMTRYPEECEKQWVGKAEGGRSKRRSSVRCSSHQGGSSQNRLGDERTYEMTLASAYVLHHLSATWSQLQMIERKSKWEGVLIGVSLLNTGD